MIIGEPKTLKRHRVETRVERERTGKRRRGEVADSRGGTSATHVPQGDLTPGYPTPDNTKAGDYMSQPSKRSGAMAGGTGGDDFSDGEGEKQKPTPKDKPDLPDEDGFSTDEDGLSTDEDGFSTDDDEDERKRDETRCRYCNHLLSTIGHRTNHENRLHTKKILSQCQHCDREFETLENLIKHEVGHKRHKRAGLIRCYTCGWRFASRKRLHEHERECADFDTADEEHEDHHDLL